MGNATGFSLDQYKRLVRSYRARFRAGVARTPAQAAAVDWAKVIDDAENGIQANFMVNTGGSTGWNVGYQVTRYQDPTWSEMSHDVHGHGGRFRRLRELHRRRLQRTRTAGSSSSRRTNAGRKARRAPRRIPRRCNRRR